MTCVLTYQIRTLLTASTTYSDHDHVHGGPSSFPHAKTAERVQGMAEAPNYVGKEKSRAIRPCIHSTGKHFGQG